MVLKGNPSNGTSARGDDLAPVGDAFLPPFDPRDWRETARQPGERGERDEADYAFVTLERRDAP